MGFDAGIAETHTTPSAFTPHIFIVQYPRKLAGAALTQRGLGKQAIARFPPGLQQQGSRDRQSWLPCLL